jgi:hypothetical protein
MRSFWLNNGLSITLFAIFLLTLIGQSVTGMSEHNDDLREHGQATLSYTAYLASGHFIESVFENWESEFLQMAAYVIFTIFLYQKGSSESKRPGVRELVDTDPRDSQQKDQAPWPVRRGGWILKVYEHSLSLALLLLFALSSILHAAGGAAEFNEEQRLHGQSDQVSTWSYMTTARFWFESFQNWQSEFLSIAVMIVLSIFLRQRGSPESKPVDAPHSETGA